MRSRNDRLTATNPTQDETTLINYVCTLLEYFAVAKFWFLKYKLDHDRYENIIRETIRSQDKRVLVLWHG